MGNEPQADSKRMAPFRITTASWVAIVVGVIMLATGVVFDIDARSVKDRYDGLSARVQTMEEQHRVIENDLRDLSNATATNTANITNLISAVADLKGLIEAHILGSGKDGKL